MAVNRQAPVNQARHDSRIRRFLCSNHVVPALKIQPIDAPFFSTLSVGVGLYVFLASPLGEFLPFVPLNGHTSFEIAGVPNRKAFAQWSCVLQFTRIQTFAIPAGGELERKFDSVQWS